MSSSDVLVPVLVRVPDVLVLGRPPGRRGRGPSRPAEPWLGASFGFSETGKILKSYDQEDLHLETIQKSFAHYKNEYQRLLEENNLLQEENQKVRRVFNMVF